MTTSPFSTYPNTNKGQKRSCDAGAYPLDGAIKSFPADGVKDNMCRRGSDAVGVFMEMDTVVIAGG